MGPLTKKYGVPQDRTRCGVGRRERNPQIDLRSVPQSSRPLQRGVPDPLTGHMAKMTTIIVFLEKSLKIPVHNHVYGLVGLSGHQRGGPGHRCHGVAHERHQNAQKWAPPWAPPSTHKNEKIKMKKNEKNHYFLRGTNAVTFQLSNHDRKMMLWGRGVTHGGAQMWRR